MFSTASAVFTVRALVCGSRDILHRDPHNPRRTMPADEPFSFRTIVTATCDKNCCVLHGAHSSLCLEQRAPIWEHALKKRVCLFPPLIYSAFVFLICQDVFPKIYLGQQGAKNGMYTRHPEANIEYYTHTHTHSARVCVCVSQNTVMLEITMTFHANRGACCAGDRLVLQAELK